jgi:hypothetical protein
MTSSSAVVANFHILLDHTSYIEFEEWNPPSSGHFVSAHLVTQEQLVSLLI